MTTSDKKVRIKTGVFKTASLKEAGLPASAPASLLIKSLCGLIVASVSIAGFAAEAPDYDALVQQAMAQRNAGDLQTAEQTLRTAYAIPSDKTEVSYLLAMVLAFQQRYTEAHELLDEVLLINPDDDTLRLGKARVTAFQGLYPAAMSMTEQVLASDPTSLEAINLAGRIALYQQQPRRALGLFESAIVLQANDLEAWIGKHDALRALGEQDAAEEALLMADAIAPGHIDVVTRQQQNTVPAGPAHLWAAGLERSGFRRVDFDEWEEFFVEYRRQRSLTSSWFVRVNEQQRFDTQDTSVQAGISLNENGALPWQINAGVSPDKNFSAGWSLGASFTHRLTEGSERLGATLLTPSLRMSDYSTGEVWRLGADFEHYVTGTNIWLTPAVGIVRDENGGNTFSWAVGAHWQINGEVRAGVNYGDGAETENKITTDTRSRSAYVQWQFAPALAVNVFAARSDRKDSYSRESVGLTLMLRY